MKSYFHRRVIKCLIIVWFSMILWQNAIGQPDPEWQIKYIREKFQQINSRCATLEPLVFKPDNLGTDGPLEIKRWTSKGWLIKTQMIEERQGGQVVTDYYFDQRGPIFVFVQEHTKDEFNQAYVRENRYYFKNDGTLIRWLDENKNKVDPSTARFQEMENDITHKLDWLSELYIPVSEDQTSDTYFHIGENYFFGIIIGQKIKDVATNLKKGLLKTGDGEFEVYYLIDQEGSQLGYIPVEGEWVSSIVVTAPNASTWLGLTVGSTFAELKEAFNNIEVHGSELEGRTTVDTGYHLFLLDTYFNTYDVDKEAIPDDVKIKAIILKSPV